MESNDLDLIRSIIEQQALELKQLRVEIEQLREENSDLKKSLQKLKTSSTSQSQYFKIHKEEIYNLADIIINNPSKAHTSELEKLLDFWNNPQTGSVTGRLLRNILELNMLSSENLQIITNHVIHLFYHKTGTPDTYFNLKAPAKAYYIIEELLGNKNLDSESIDILLKYWSIGGAQGHHEFKDDKYSYWSTSNYANVYNKAISSNNFIVHEKTSYSSKYFRIVPKDEEAP